MTRSALGVVPTAVLYTAARIGLVAAVAGVLVVVGVPLLLAALIGIIVALPLSMVVFRGLRDRLDSAVAAVAARRSDERSALRARLRGDDLPRDLPRDPTGEVDASEHRRQAETDGREH